MSGESVSHACATYVKNPAQWYESTVSGVSKCYGVLDPSMQSEQYHDTNTWTDCEHNCHYEGCQHEAASYCPTNARPVRARSKEENAEVAANLFPFVDASKVASGLWIAPRILSGKWVFGGNGGPKAVPYFNWAAGEPAASQEASILMEDGTWAAKGRLSDNEATCICEIQLTDFVSPPPYVAPSPSPPPPEDGGGGGGGGGAVAAPAGSAAAGDDGTVIIIVILVALAILLGLVAAYLVHHKRQGRRLASAPQGNELARGAQAADKNDAREVLQPDGTAVVGVPA